MMPDYHIGALDPDDVAKLNDPDSAAPATSEPRPIFLQSKAWSKAVLSAKRRISADTKIFSFTLDHAAQSVGLPIGQHLMMRLRDPSSREAIIRAYTPVSEHTDCGVLHVLVKIYYDAPDRQGGRMTQALDALPLGDAVDFKGPVGKFEYLGRGRCNISGRERRVRRFIMVCAGSGITPIFQVLRAVLRDPEDPTFCLVLDGNRVEEDILCKAEMDAMAEGQAHKCRLLYALTRPEAHWTGLRGRMDKELFEREVGLCRNKDTGGEDLVLVCGPESMEKSVRTVFSAMGWADEDLLFF
jgi:nitrate reductase (NAD(P)H)